MSDTPNYVEYRPPADGVAPPYWREGMAWGLLPDGSDFDTIFLPAWGDDTTYYVSPEALTAPNEDAATKWKAADAADIASMVESLRTYPADELAKHGITLEPPKDWARELWADLNEAWDRGSFNGDNEAGDKAAIALIRERVVLKEGV